jgi:hypothetical protein
LVKFLAVVFHRLRREILITGWDHPNPNRDRYRDRSGMTLGHEKLGVYRLVRENQGVYSVDFDPDSDFDPDENGSQQTDTRDAHSTRQ